MITFFIRKYFPSRREKEWELNARDLLSSIADDADLALDWCFLYDIQKSRQGEVPNKLSWAQLTFTVLGTVSWLLVASDGRAVQWLLNLLLRLVSAVISVSFALVYLPICPCLYCAVCCARGDHCRVCAGAACGSCVIYDGMVNYLSPLIAELRIASGSLLLLGILFEDMPQVVISLLIENELKDDSDGQDDLCNADSSVTALAVANILTSIYNISIKATDAYDQWRDTPKYFDYEMNFRGHSVGVNSVAVVGDDRFLSGSGDETIKLWSMSSEECIRTFGGHSRCVNSVAVVGDDHFLSGSDDKTIKLWSMSSEESIRTFEGHSDKVTSVDVVADDRFLSGSRDNTIKLWFVVLGSKGSLGFTLGECISTFKGHSSDVTSVAVVGDDRFLSGSNDKTIKLWSMSSEQCIRTFEVHSYVRSVAVMGDDRFLSGAYNKTTRLWNISTGKCIRTFKGRVHSVAVIGNDRFLSGSPDNTIKLWNISTGKCIRTFKGHTGTGGVSSVAVIGDDQFLSGSSDGTIKLWLLPPREEKEQEPVASEESETDRVRHDHGSSIEEADGANGQESETASIDLEAGSSENTDRACEEGSND